MILKYQKTLNKIKSPKYSEVRKISYQEKELRSHHIYNTLVGDWVSMVPHTCNPYIPQVKAGRFL